MALKVPEDVAGEDQQGDEIGTEQSLQEKYAWQQDRGVQFNPTASILRYTFTGADSSIRDRGTGTLVSDLADLPCTVDDYTKNFERKYGSIAEAGDKLFTFYNVQVVPNDRIDYKDNLWKPVSVWYFEESGRCEVQARLVADSS